MLITVYVAIRRIATMVVGRRYDVYLVLATTAAAAAMTDIRLMHIVSGQQTSSQCQSVAESTSRDAIRLRSVVTRQRKHASRPD